MNSKSYIIDLVRYEMKALIQISLSLSRPHPQNTLDKPPQLYHPIDLLQPTVTQNQSSDYSGKFEPVTGGNPSLGFASVP